MNRCVAFLLSCPPPLLLRRHTALYLAAQFCHLCVLSHVFEGETPRAKNVPLLDSQSDVAIRS